MAQLVFIVSRRRPKLRDYLQREFAENAEVTVIVDRRVGKRRLEETPRRPEETPRRPDRRLTDRRQELMDERLRSLGWTIVWRDEATTVCVQREEGARFAPETEPGTASS
jgi:hypothetical protein